MKYAWQIRIRKKNVILYFVFVFISRSDSEYRNYLENCPKCKFLL